MITARRINVAVCFTATIFVISLVLNEWNKQIDGGINYTHIIPCVVIYTLFGVALWYAIDKTIKQLQK